MQIPSISLGSIEGLYPSSVHSFFSNLASRITSFVTPSFKSQEAVISGLIENKWQILAIASATVALLIATRVLYLNPTAKPASAKAEPETKPAVDTKDQTSETKPEANSADRVQPDAEHIDKKNDVGAADRTRREEEIEQAYDAQGNNINPTWTPALDRNSNIVEVYTKDLIQHNYAKGALSGAAFFAGAYALYDLPHTVTQLFLAVTGFIIGAGVHYAWKHAEATVEEERGTKLVAINQNGRTTVEIVTRGKIKYIPKGALSGAAIFAGPYALYYLSHTVTLLILAAAGFTVGVGIHYAWKNSKAIAQVISTTKNPTTTTTTA